MKNSLFISIISFFLPIMLLTRLCLFLFAMYNKQVFLNYYSPLIFIEGAFYDFVTAIYITIPILFLALLLPKKIKCNKFFICFVFFLSIFFLILNLIAEMLFWEEFGTRFNFIAVDYLVYTHEVVKNIYESYPIIRIIALITVFSLITTFFYFKYILVKKKHNHLLKEILVILISLAVVIFYVDDTTFENQDRYENELLHNGIYNLFSAFKNNKLNYNNFYATVEENEAFIILKKALKIKNKSNELNRFINNGEKKNYNVILITVESLSAEYMEIFGNKKKLTPYLDKLTNESLFFNNIYATGTRTVRGLEALTLSIPPTPGNSIVRRPNNEKLFSIGSVLHKADYQLKFLYGGNGYFDNMNYFFSHNYFDIIDKGSLSKEEITFSNAWGVADEDIFMRSIKEADLADSKGINFFHFIMTTSNHRPFTYPENKIDIPSKSGRNGAVKYTDYAIKQLIETSRTKPWFENTIFVITADHCAGSSGKTDLPIERYHIPLIIYAPHIFESKTYSNLASQIDIAPTILALLGISYESKFYGTNIITDPSERAFVSTYQKLGYYKNNRLVVLGPKQEVNYYKISNSEQQKISLDGILPNEAISFYQTAYNQFTKGLMKE